MGLRPQHFKKKLSSRLIKREDLQMSIRHVPICFSLVNWGASWPRHAALRPAKASLRGTGRRKVQGRLRQNVPGHTGDRRWPGPDLTSDLPQNIRVTADMPFPVSGTPRDLSPVSRSLICGGKTFSALQVRREQEEGAVTFNRNELCAQRKRLSSRWGVLWIIQKTCICGKPMTFRAERVTLGRRLWDTRPCASHFVISCSRLRGSAYQRWHIVANWQIQIKPSINIHYISLLQINEIF